MPECMHRTIFGGNKTITVSFCCIETNLWFWLWFKIASPLYQWLHAQGQTKLFVFVLAPVLWLCVGLWILLSNPNLEEDSPITNTKNFVKGLMYKGMWTISFLSMFLTTPYNTTSARYSQLVILFILILFVFTDRKNIWNSNQQWVLP